MRILLCTVICAVSMFFAGCAISGTIVDRSQNSADLKKMRLSGSSSLSIYCGGAKRDLPLKAVRSMKIDPFRTTSVDGLLYLGVEAELADGTRIDGSDRGDCFISSDNGLVGISGKGSYSVTLDNVSSITVGKK